MNLERRLYLKYFLSAFYSSNVENYFFIFNKTSLKI
jgi:hypothetical protein